MIAELLAVSLLSGGLLVAFGRHAEALGFIDTPNHRSSHHRPTPVGGGICFAIAITGTLAISAGVAGDAPGSTWTLCGIGILIASVGLLDDRWCLPVWPRMVLYALSAVVLAVTQLHEVPVWILLLVVFGLTWLINLVNFMDGSDGLVATHSMAVCAGMASIGLFFPEAGPVVSLALLILFALLPFLWMNWPPASVFMGDSGAVFLGLFLGALGLASWQVSDRLACAWLAMMMPFIVDSGMTLVIRAVKGQSVFAAHREHGYQRLLRYGESPLLPLLGLLAIHGVWQFPCALVVVQTSYSPLVAVIFSAIPSIVVVTYLQRHT